jgi:hypothetical protein
MPANDYHFITHWTAPGATLEEVYAVIADVEALPRWWPAVYLMVTPAPGTGVGIGQAYDLYTKGWLPYTLRWRLTVQEVRPPFGSTIGAFGDFEGRGIWSFRRSEAGVDITFDWKLQAEKPLLRLLSPLLKPAFAANHRWAMATGQVSLLRELERRRARGVSIAPPPGPTTWQPWAVFGGAAIGLLAAAVLWRRQGRPPR